MAIKRKKRSSKSQDHRTHEEFLRSILKLKAGSKNILNNRESAQLEFKRTFNFGDKAKYVKTIASFANNQGGYIIFGVEPSPHRLKGVNLTNFESFDPSKLTEYLNATLSPEVDWELDSFEAFGVKLGFIYIKEAREKPVVAITNKDVLKEGSIYYRYKGQSTLIKYSELRKIIDDRLERERHAWLQHLEIISHAGPTNVGVIDTLHGRIYGGGAPFLIDEKLLRQLKFIREGHFKETGGNPTLTVLGEVQTISSKVTKEVQIPSGIHMDDLITAFLAQRKLDISEAKSYLKETAYQTSPYIPLFYFLKTARINSDEAKNIIDTALTASAVQKMKIIKRLYKKELIKPIGKVESSKSFPKKLSMDVIIDRMKQFQSELEKRSFLAYVLKRKSSDIQSCWPELNIIRLFEAITNLETETIKNIQKDLLEILLSIFRDRFATMSSREKTAFRKAIAYCDESLYLS
jgi:hypothetical protein